MASRQWDEKEWQKYTNELLATHHSLRKEKYQRIPDVKGDHGLEGVSDLGDAYQAYADQDSRDHDHRVEKQKKKIYDDLRKLDEYKDFWAEYFGDKKIHRWILMVPKFADKEVVKYAKTRARELKKKNLPFIADDFDAFVCTADDFPEAKLIARNPHLPRRTPDTVTDADVEAFVGEEPVFIQKMDEKIAKVLVSKTPEQRLAYRKKLLKWHLESSNFGADLEQNFPPQWEELEALITTTGESLETEAPLDAAAPNVRLTRTKREFSGAVKEQLPFIANDDREVIAWGTVARWLGECPLDF
jgi:hypothetical protein